MSSVKEVEICEGVRLTSDFLAQTMSMFNETFRRHPNGGGWVSDTAEVADTVQIGPFAVVSGEAKVTGSVQVLDTARVRGEAKISGHATIAQGAWVFGNAKVSDNAQVGGRSRVFGRAKVDGDTCVIDEDLS